MTEYQSVIQRGPATQAEESRERAVIVGVDRPGLEWPLESSLAELERLADTAGADVVASTMQRLDAPNPRTFVGSGKAEEIAELARSSEADLVIFDDELTVVSAAFPPPQAVIETTSPAASVPETAFFHNPVFFIIIPFLSIIIHFK